MVLEKRCFQAELNNRRRIEAIVLLVEDHRKRLREAIRDLVRHSLCERLEDAINVVQLGKGVAEILKNEKVNLCLGLTSLHPA